MDLSEFGNNAPLIAISISIITLLVTFGKWLVKKYNEDFDERIKDAISENIGGKMAYVESKYIELKHRVDTLYQIVLKTNMKMDSDINDNAEI